MRQYPVPLGPQHQSMLLPCKACVMSRVRQISPVFPCIKFFWPQDVQTQIAGHPGHHSLSKTPEKGALHKVLVQDIPRLGSGISRRVGPWYPWNILPQNFIFTLVFPSRMSETNSIKFHCVRVPRKAEKSKARTTEETIQWASSNSWGHFDRHRIDTTWKCHPTI